MTIESHQKLNAGHLKRNAYLYIRQSTPRQVLENIESTQRQYALLQVDPDNRLVADALEADWNLKLCALADAQQQYERQRGADQRVIDAERGRCLSHAGTEGASS